MLSIGRVFTSRLPVPVQFLLQRAMLTPTFRFSAFVILPNVLLLLVLAWWLSETQNLQRAEAVLRQVESRFKYDERFNVTGLNVVTESPELKDYLQQHIDFERGSSLFDIRPRLIKETLENLSAVISASVIVVPGGGLEVSVSERKPAIVLRQPGSVALLDRFGELAFSGNLEAALQDLPLMAGAGAGSNVVEALDIYSAAEPIRESIRGLLRIGERRWDLHLDGERIIQLPEENPVAAIKHLLAYDRKYRLLARDFEFIDLRIKDQTIVRLTPEVFATTIGNSDYGGGDS